MLRKTLPLPLLSCALMLAFGGLTAHASPLLLLRAAQDPAPAKAPVAARKAEKKTGPLATTFDKAEMEAMVAELSAYIPQNPELAYPINSDFVKTKDVNAYATVEGTGANGKPQAIMRILTGILVFIDESCANRVVVGLDSDDPSKKITLAPGDERRLLRAVVAHEMGHLSKGHVLRGNAPKGADMKVIYTRETEQEADMVGAAALQRAGYGRKDAEQMLLMIDAADNARGGSIAGNLLNDHADGKRRALSVADDPRVLKSLAEFDLGLAFGEVRNYEQATLAFDRAAAREPKLKEAYVNAAQSAATFYYESLPLTLRTKWFRPDFGPFLASPLASRGGELVDADRKRYANAQRHAALALQKAPDNARAIEIAGLVDVLNPDGNAGQISNGIKSLQRAAEMAMDPNDQIRVANNLAVGYQRAGDVTKGTSLLVTTFAATKRYNAAGVDNLGFAPLPPKIDKEAGIVAGAMYMYLNSAPKDAPGYPKVAAAYDSVTSTYGLQKKEVATKGSSLNLCEVYSLVDGGTEIALFDQYADVNRKLGSGIVEVGIAASGDDRYKEGQAVGVFSVKYRSGQVLALFQSRGEDDQSVARVTSYSPKAYLELKPKEAGQGEPFRVVNGMKSSDLYARIPEDEAFEVRLYRVGQLEEWNYFPGLNFGVQIKDGVVVGLTASPAK